MTDAKPKMDDLVELPLQPDGVSQAMTSLTGETLSPGDRDDLVTTKPPQQKKSVRLATKMTAWWRSIFGRAPMPSIWARLSLGGRGKDLLHDDTKKIIEDGFRIAEENLHSALSLEHLLCLLLEDPEIKSLLKNVGASLDGIQLALQNRVAQKESTNEAAFGVYAAPPALQAVHRAMLFVLGISAEKVLPVHLFVAALAEMKPELLRIFHRYHCDRFSVVLYLSHGVLRHEVNTATLPDGVVRVVMYNDNYTTQEWVTYVLCECFLLDVAEARGFMLEIHNHGQATVSHLKKQQAEVLVKDILKQSAASGMPLKLDLVPAY